MSPEGINLKIDEALSDPKKFIDEKLEESQLIVNTINQISMTGYISFPLYSLYKVEDELSNFLNIAKRNNKNNLFQYLKLGRKFIHLQLKVLDCLENTADSLNLTRDMVLETRDNYTMALMMVEERISNIVKERSTHYGEDNMYEDYDPNITDYRDIGTNPEETWEDFIDSKLDGIKHSAFTAYDGVR